MKPNAAEAVRVYEGLLAGGLLTQHEAVLALAGLGSKLSPRTAAGAKRAFMLEAAAALLRCDDDPEVSDAAT